MLRNGLDLCIRQPLDSEASDIAKFYETNFDEHILVKRGILSNPEEIERELHEKNKMWITARIDKTLVGCSAIEAFDWNNSAELQRAATNKEFRRMGIEKEMCKTRLSIAENIGATYAFSYVRGPSYGAQKSLEGLGFRVAGIIPVFYVNHNGKEVRENFVYMFRFLNNGEKELESFDNLIPMAKVIKDTIENYK